MVEEEVSEGDATAQSENLEEDESLLEVGEGEEGKHECFRRFCLAS